MKRAFILAVSVFALVSIKALAEQSEGHQKYKAQQIEQSRKNSDQRPSSTFTGEKKEEIETDWKNVECSNPKDHNQADLCEQRRMAKSAEDTYTLNQWQFFLGIIGALLLGLTIFYARESAKAATNAAEAAEKAVTNAQAHAAQELRAYVSLESAHIEIRDVPNNLTSKRLRVVLDIKNSGQTPAYDVTTSFVCEVWDIPHIGATYREVEQRNDRDGKSIVGPGATFEIRLNDLIIPYSDVSLIDGGMKKIYIWGRVDYRDIFNEWRWVRTRLRSLELSKNVWKVGPCQEGNEAN